MTRNNIFPKKSLSIDERINKLKNRNLMIDNYQLLYDYIHSSHTYYHLTGYRFLLENYNKDTDDYCKHRSSELIALCELDKQLSLIFFEEVRKVEESLRTRLANLCYSDDMVTFIYDEENKVLDLKDNYCINEGQMHKFISVTQYDKIKHLLYSDIFKSKDDPAINHYIHKYDAVIPIWVIINFISFGKLIKLIDCLTTVKMTQFMEEKPYKRSLNNNDPSRINLLAICMLRNKVSHHSNILGKQSPYIVSNKLFSIYYLGFISLYKWNLFLYNTNITLPLQRKINDCIVKVNDKFNTNFDSQLIKNKKIIK